MKRKAVIRALSLIIALVLTWADSGIRSLYPAAATELVTQPETAQDADNAEPENDQEIASAAYASDKEEKKATKDDPDKISPKKQKSSSIKANVSARLVNDKHISVKAVNAGDGRIKKTLVFTLPKKSSWPYSDQIDWDIRPLRSTGKGREGSGHEELRSEQNGNTLTVYLDKLLDYERYELTVRYTQTYFWDISVPYDAYVGDKLVTLYYDKMMEASDSGNLTKEFTTQKDKYIRKAADLKEKVHKYSSVEMAGDIDMGEEQCIVDGGSRGNWLFESAITAGVSINGNGRRVRRGNKGACFIVHSGAGLDIRELYIDAFSGQIIETPTTGNEYITRNASGGADGVGILVGFDSIYDADNSSSSGRLSLKDSEVYGGRSAVVFRYGKADIHRSTLYGMGEANVFTAPDKDSYYGTGLGLINSSKDMGASVTVGEDCSIYGRFNGVMVAGSASLSVADSYIRGDCEDAFDFRGKGDLSISDCLIEGVKGVDIYHDATFHAIMEALDISSGSFDGSAFRRTVPADRYPYTAGGDKTCKGTVSIRDSSMNIYTGVFREIASIAGCGIQNHGQLELGHGISINVRHSGAWDSLPSGSRSKAIGIWNSKKLTLPSDISIVSDDDGIECIRDVNSIRNALHFYYGMSDEETAAIEKRVTADQNIFTDLDDGLHLSLTVKGGSIDAGDTAIMQPFGNLSIEPETDTEIKGINTGITVGKNEEDNIYGDQAMNVSLQIYGERAIRIASSLQGKGIVVKRSANAIIEAPLTICGTDSRCGRGIENYGFTQLKRADIEAEEAGILNGEGGSIYLGDDLDQEAEGVTIKGAVCGIDNRGSCIYYRNTRISESRKAAVLQGGSFYMQPGAEVAVDDAGHNCIYLKKDATVRLMYDEAEEDLIPATRGSFLTADSDRAPGRVMVELYSPWSVGGGEDYSDESCDKISYNDKIRITDMLGGFSLAFDKVKDHKAALRSGLGKWKEKKTNGRTGTLILSCLLSASYEADFPVKNDHISSVDPEPTKYYWREPTEFTVASDLYDTDRARIFYDGADITKGLLQKGWRDKGRDGKYGEELYHEKRITRVYDDDHIFSGLWDTQFEFYFDGNGQTNGKENYTEGTVSSGYAFPGNSGPERKEREYFKKDIIRDGSHHPCGFDGWSLDNKAVYKDSGIYRKGSLLDDAVSFYIKAVSMGNVKLSEDKATVTIYAVWDEFPVITAYDSSFYASELSDDKAVKKKLLSEDTVTATDLCDGDIEQGEIGVFTDPTRDSFDIEMMKGLGDRGYINIYYKAKDKNGHTSAVQAKAYIMTEDSEDSLREPAADSLRGNSGSSKDSIDASPLYIRHIDKVSRDSLTEGSVWTEEGYSALLDRALKADAYTQKWHFSNDDIKASRELLYGSGSDGARWQSRFIKNRVYSEMLADNDRNKPLFIEEGLSSLKVTYDLKSETDRIGLTLTCMDTMERKTISLNREAGKRMASSVIIDSLRPGKRYDVTADLYYRGSYLRTISGSASTASLQAPECSLSSEDRGKCLEVRISIKADQYAEEYIVEGRKSGKDSDWSQKEIIRNTGDKVLTFKETIEKDGVYQYRIKSRGSELGSKDPTEVSEYSKTLETGFLRQPQIKEIVSGCRSLGIEPADDTRADYIRIFYQAADGALMHSDFNDKKNMVISDQRLRDGEKYRIWAQAFIRSEDTGLVYASLISETKEGMTLDIRSPVIIRTKQKDIYSAAGNRIEYFSDHRAVKTELFIRKVFRQKGEEERIILAGKEQDSDTGEYLHSPGESGVYSYMVRTEFMTLDGKKFELDSDRIEAAYLLPQQAIDQEIKEGDQKEISLLPDQGISGYVIMIERADGSKKKVYVPEGADVISIKATGNDLVVKGRYPVIYYNGKEYRGECV